jgi:hypothetical protein
VRERIADLLFPTPTDSAVPDHFDSKQAYFDFISPQRAETAGAAYERWQREGTLASFVDYLGGVNGRFGLTEPVPAPESLTLQSPGVLVLDRMLARLADAPFATVVLLMPENPLLDDDAAGTYHRPGFSQRAAELIRQVADRYHIRVVDGRHWMPADRFVDFVHVFPDLSGFQDPLASEILHALGS